MKKMILLASIVAATSLTGCQAPYSGGVVYNNFRAPIDVRDNAGDCSKRGVASMVNVLNILSFGDAGVAAAKEQAGVTKVTNVDMNFQSLLGIFGKTTTVVCGE